MNESSDEERSVQGRRILVGLGVVVVGLAGLVGLVVGALGAERDAAVVVFGAVTLPTAPGAVAVYAAALAAVVLGVLYVAVEAASKRAEADRP